MLGPLEVLRDGRPVDLRGTKRRAVLALLVLQANEVVRTDRLIEDLWGADRPANAPGALHNHLSRLRKDLGEDALATKPWGYVLRADPDAIDVRRFESLVDEARPLPARERSAKLADALALWRGPALADLANEPALEAEVARLDELRQSAVEQRIDARLELGEHAEVIRELERLIAEHPLRERLRGQLILALYRSGRQAEALETYRETRRVLVDELGIEPSPELRELEKAILRQDPALAAVAAAPSVREPEGPNPPHSRWRWPRSPLIAGAAVLLVALAGLAVAILSTPRSGTPHADAARPPASAALTATAGSTSNALPTVATSTKHGQRPSHGANPRPRPRNQEAKPPPAQVTPPSTRSNPKPTASKPSSGRPAKHPPPPSLKPPPTPPPPPPITDDFADGAIDPQMWYALADGSGVTLEERAGRLEMAIAADAAGNKDGVIQAHYGTRCRFSGDFDVKVDYELVEWPSTAGVVVQLTAWFEGNQMSAGRTSVGGEEAYTTTAPPGWNWQLPTSDSSGSLRIKRINDALKTYYRTSGRWHQLYYFVEAINARGGRGAPVIGLQVFSRDEWFGDRPVRIAFDNFSVTQKRRACG